MLKRFLGLLCLIFFYGGSGLHSFLFNFELNFGSYYQHLLSEFVNEVVSSGGGRTEEELKLIVEIYLGLSDETYPKDLMREFYGRKIVQVVFSSLVLLIGLWLFKSSYKTKTEVETETTND